MPDVEYTFSKLCDPGRLRSEIQSSTIITALSYIETASSPVSTSVWFKASLSGGDETTLDGIIDDHTNTPLPQDVVSTMQTLPFSSKKIGSLSLFNRTHGANFSLSQGANNSLDFEITYDQVKFNGVEIVNGDFGDTANLKVVDTDGDPIPAYYEADLVLNQFGFNVNVHPDVYTKESKYDADLYKGMRIRIDYTSTSAKTIYVNYLLHELK